MKCICKLRVDKLKKNFGTAQSNVLGLLPILPNLSELESLAENATENLGNIPTVSAQAFAAAPIVSLSESEAATVSAAEQLSATASLQASLQAELGVNLASSSAPKALGGIIEAAQLSGLIGVLETVANFKGIDPLAAVGAAINAISDKLGIDLLEDKYANDAADDLDRISDSAGNNNDDKRKPKETKPKEETPEDIAKKRDDELPGMIGDSCRKLNDYIKESPGISKTSLADLIIESLGDSLSISLDDLDLNDLVHKAIQSVEKDFASELIEDPDPKEEDAEEVSPLLFSVDDFINLSSFAVKLKDAIDPVSLFLNNQFEQSTKDLLSAYDSSTTPSEKLQNALIDELNKVIQERVSIYDKTRFAEVTLRKQTTALTRMKRQGEALIRLNRYLLEDAYLQEIASNRKDDVEKDDVEKEDDENKEKTSFPDLVETVRNMVQHNLQGRDTWDQKEKAAEALKKLDELERLREEKLREQQEKEKEDEPIKEANEPKDDEDEPEDDEDEPEETQGPSLFSVADYIDYGRLAHKLKNETDTVSIFLKNQSEQSTKDLLSAYHSPMIPSLFSVADFIDLSSFVHKLKNETDTVSIFLKNQLEQSTKDLLSAYDSSTAPSKDLQGALVQELNRVSQGGSSIYDETRFEEVVLCKEATSLTRIKQQGESLIRLNRYLLEDAYPQEIAKYRPTSTTPSKELRDALLEELNKVLQGGVSIYDQTRFAEVVLRQETEELRAKNQQGKSLISLNRYLLEDAYPQEIAKNKKNISKLVKSSANPAKQAVKSSVKASNIAVKASNRVDLFIQINSVNPTVGPETTGLLRELSNRSVEFALKAAEAMTNSLNAMKESMAYAALGDRENAEAAMKLARKYATEAEAAKIQANHAYQRIIYIINAIKAAEKKAKEEAAANAGSGANDNSDDSGEDGNVAERQRIVNEAVDSAEKSAMRAFGGSISSPTGLSLTARSIAAININGPAIAMISATVSTEMLLKAMTKLSMFLLLKDLFGDNLFSSSGGPAIAASFGLVASASASASASAGAGVGVSAGASASAGIGASASAGVSASAGAGASAGASLSANAAINGLSGLLAGAPPSPIAIMLLIAILGQLKALGHNVVASSPCHLSLNAMAGNDIDKYYDKDNLDSTSNSEKSTDTFAVMNNLKAWLRSSRFSKATIEAALRKAANLLNLSVSELLASTELAGIPSLANINPDEDEDQDENEDDTLASSDSPDLEISSLEDVEDLADLAGKDELGKDIGSNLVDKGLDETGLDEIDSGLKSDSGSWFHNARRTSPKSDLKDGLDDENAEDSLVSGASTDDGGSNLNVPGSDGSDSDSSASGLAASDSSDSDPSASGSGSGQDSDSAGADATGDPSDNDDTQNASGNGDSTDDGAGKMASSGDGSDDSDSGKSSLGGQVAAGVAVGAIGAVGIGAMAAFALKGSGNGAGGSESGGNSESGDGSALASGDGIGNGDDQAGGADSGNSAVSSGLGLGGANLGNSGKEDKEETAWHQRAKHGDPSKHVPEETYAVGDPTANKQEDEEPDLIDDFDSEELEEGKAWHQRAKHEKPSKLNPDEDDNFDIKDIIDTASDLDDSNESSKS
ncbi:MAG: hypothetical protein ACJAUA_000546 [Zhongshania aliphaticivorans]|jgi:hypothetical protein